MRSRPALPATCSFGSTKGGCPPRPELPHGASLRQIVDHYITHRRADTREERNRFRRSESIETAVDLAAGCNNEHGKRHPHQRRIPARSLRRMQQRLASVDLLASSSFDEIHDLVEDATDDVRMIGRLTVYDVATRIGAYLDLPPKCIYLHAGTRTGAQALGLDVKRRTLERSELPREFRRLTPAECEDVLCIYKDHLPAAKGAGAERARPRKHRA